MSRKQLVTSEEMVLARREGARDALNYFKVFHSSPEGHTAREKFVANRFPLYRVIRLTTGNYYRIVAGKLEYSFDGETWHESKNDAPAFARDLTLDGERVRALILEPIAEDVP